MGMNDKLATRVKDAIKNSRSFKIKRGGTRYENDYIFPITVKGIQNKMSIIIPRESIENGKYVFHIKFELTKDRSNKLENLILKYSIKDNIIKKEDNYKENVCTIIISDGNNTFENSIIMLDEFVDEKEQSSVLKIDDIKDTLNKENECNTLEKYHRKENITTDTIENSINPYIPEYLEQSIILDQTKSRITKTLEMRDKGTIRKFEEVRNIKYYNNDDPSKIKEYLFNIKMLEMIGIQIPISETQTYPSSGHTSASFDKGIQSQISLEKNRFRQGIQIGQNIQDDKNSEINMIDTVFRLVEDTQKIEIGQRSMLTLPPSKSEIEQFSSSSQETNMIKQSEDKRIGISSLSLKDVCNRRGIKK